VQAFPVNESFRSNIVVLSRYRSRDIVAAVSTRYADYASYGRVNVYSLTYIDPREKHFKRILNFQLSKGFKKLFKGAADCSVRVMAWCLVCAHRAVLSASFSPLQVL
jgi:hypothetical protein